MNLLLIIGFAVLTYVGIRRFIQRAPKQGAGFLTRLLIVILIVTLIVLAVTGRLHWIIGLLAALFPLIKRFLPILIPIVLRILPFLKQVKRAKGAKNRTAGQHSEIKTRYVNMILDHDSGTISGEVIAGPYQGRTLAQLSMKELDDLYRHCQSDDHEAVRILDSYIQRYCNEQWQQYQSAQDNHSNQHHNNHYQKHHASSGNNAQMSDKEASEVLGLEPNASKQDIIQAHKRMMAKVHPDKGGSNYLASKINQAKEILLESINQKR